MICKKIDINISKFFDISGINTIRNNISISNRYFDISKQH